MLDFWSNNWGSAHFSLRQQLFLKHGVGVFRFFRNILDYVPVFHDLPVFDPEDIYGGLATVLGVQFNVVMDE